MIQFTNIFTYKKIYGAYQWTEIMKRKSSRNTRINLNSALYLQDKNSLIILLSSNCKLSNTLED